MDCIFCKIINKQINANILYEDDQALAFEDINPQAPVHILIIPKKHIPNNLAITDKDKELIGHLFQIANKIAVEKAIADKGFRLVTNCNKEAGQAVFHLHIHLLGGRVMHWPPG